MVTKAGVDSTKLVIGMALYGRSFKMTKAGCTGPMCTYVGKESAAAKGRCTDTRGYISNYEIREIIAGNHNVKQIADKDGDILIYDDTEWVSWLTKGSYDSRVSWIRGLDFRGSVDWAIDLNAAYDVGDGPGSPGGPGTGLIYISPDLYDEKEPVVQCNKYPCTFVFPPWTLESATTIVPEKTTLTFLENWLTTAVDEISGSLVTSTLTASSISTAVITPSPVTVSTGVLSSNSTSREKTVLPE